MSHLFQRPLCDMGRAYDFAFRPLVGEPDAEDGGGCDDRPRGVELCSADTLPTAGPGVWQSFSLCPEHDSQLQKYDARLRTRGIPSRFRIVGSGTSATGRER